MYLLFRKSTLDHVKNFNSKLVREKFSVLVDLAVQVLRHHFERKL